MTFNGRSLELELQLSAATLEQLLIKCLAQGHTKVIQGLLPLHTHTHIFQILLFSNSSRCGILFLLTNHMLRDNQRFNERQVFDLQQQRDVMMFAIR